MLIYNYSRTTYELVGRPVEARLDPVGGNPMIPAFATSVEPPVITSGNVAVYDPQSKTWSVQVDLRGVTYYDADMKSVTIREIGEEVPSGCTTQNPPENAWYYVLSDKNWIPKPIADIREMKIQQAYNNTSMAMTALLSGYSSIEMDTWSKMNEECIKFKSDGTVGPLMTAKVSSSPIYNTPEKLADMTVSEYATYITGKYALEAQRDQHKLNIASETDVYQLILYDTSVSL